MAASLRTRKKASAQKTTQDLTLLLAKSIGIDLTQEYDPDAFASFAVDMYQSTNPEVYTEQGMYVYNLLQQLYVNAPEVVQEEVAPQRTTKVWYQRQQVKALTDAQIVDVLIDVNKEELFNIEVQPVLDTNNEDLLFLAMSFND